MTILIKNAKILNNGFDSKKNFDIFISKDKISAIGNFVHKNASQIIDAKGSYVSYGFVDSYNELDHNFFLLNKDNHNQFIKNGITDIIFGYNGFSLAPFFYPQPYKAKYYNHFYRKNLDWQKISEFLIFLKKKYDINFYTFVGFDSLRYIISGKENHKILNNKEFLVFLNLLVNSLKEGALGISLDLDDVFTKKISWEQIKEISKILSGYNKVLAVSLPLVGSQEFEEAIEKLLDICLKTNVKIILSNYLNRYLDQKINISIFKKINNLYPKVFLIIPPYFMESFYFYKILPFWFRNQSFEEIVQNLNDEWFLKRILNELPEFSDDLIIAEFDNIKNVENKNIKDLMSFYGTINRKKAIAQFAFLNRLRILLLDKNINFDVFVDALLAPFSFVGSYSFYLIQNFNAFEDFINLLLDYNLIGLEKIIQKIAFNPFKFFDIKNKGEFKENHQANLVGFEIKDKKIKIKFTILNGKVVYENND